MGHIKIYNQKWKIPNFKKKFFYILSLFSESLTRNLVSSDPNKMVSYMLKPLARFCVIKNVSSEPWVRHALKTNAFSTPTKPKNRRSIFRGSRDFFLGFGMWVKMGKWEGHMRKKCEDTGEIYQEGAEHFHDPWISPEIQNWEIFLLACGFDTSQFRLINSAKKYEEKSFPKNLQRKFLIRALTPGNTQKSRQQLERKSFMWEILSW